MTSQYIPTTWDQLKAAMRHRFVPSYFARDLRKQMQLFSKVLSLLWTITRH
jgi:hypothetical protein